MNFKDKDLISNIIERDQNKMTIDEEILERDKFYGYSNEIETLKEDTINADELEKFNNKALKILEKQSIFNLLLQKIPATKELDKLQFLCSQLHFDFVGVLKFLNV
jgi:hypothetical protein